MTDTTIDTRCRVMFEVGADVFETLYERAADTDLDGEVMSSNNQLGSYVRLRVLTDPADADVSGWEVDNRSHKSSRTVALHVPESEFEDLRASYEDSDLADDPRGRNCKHANNRFSEHLRRLAVSHMDD